ncbi:hypothetical protein AX14_007008 [Amanita brunnescens Koide BX004]|nr:hypothetical protein AX14_007008 [Amanita brunnescens Koide BX004]
MDGIPKLVDGKVCSVYEAQFKDAPPTQRQAYQLLVEAERISELSIFTLKTNNPPLPEADVLFLPSALNDHMHHSLGLQALVDTELRLRKGQAFDALDKLRMSIHIWNLHFEFKKLEVHGQQQNTRAQQLLKSLRNNIVTAADTYHHARNALLHLGISENDAAFHPLLDTELYMKNTGKLAKLGDNKKEDPWFWYTGQPDGLSSKAWFIELDRVKWFRDRAAHD